MATFNDFENTVEETLRVDLRNRITPQEVKFINRKNRFYGTFDGQVNSTGAKLDNVEITNAKFYDEDGNLQDMNELMAMGSRLDEVERKVEDDLPKMIEEKILYSQGVVSDKIDELGTKMETLSKEVAEGDGALAESDRALGERIDNLDKKIGAAKAEVDGKLDGIQDGFDSKINGVTDKINEETKNREEAVEKLGAELKGDISKVDDELNGRIDSEVFDRIAKDRHYAMNDVSNADVNYRMKDFAVNFIDTDVADGEVFGTSKVGKVTNVVRDEDGKIKSLDFTTLNDFNDPSVEGCFPPYSTRYVLDGTKEAFGGWQVSLVERVADLADAKIRLSFYAKGGCTIRTQDGIQVGRLLDDEYDSDGKLISGKIELLPGTASPLSSVNGESLTFNETVQDKYVTDKKTGLGTRITVIPGLKKIHVKTGIRVRSEIPLRNELSSGAKVGYISNGDVFMDSVRLHVVDSVPEQLTGTYELNAESGYKHEIDRDFTLDYVQDEKRFRIYRKNEYRKYNLKVVNSSDESKTTSASVEPDIANRDIAEGGFNSVRFSFTDGEIPMFGSREVALERNDGFAKVVKNESGDKLVVEFDEQMLKVYADVHFDRGGDWKKVYVIDSDNVEIVPKPIVTVVRTQEIDLENPVYEDAEDEGEYNADLEIGPHVDVSKPDHKVLTVSTTNAGSITLECPKDGFSGTEQVSREFFAVIDITGHDGELVKVRFADGVRIVNHVADGEGDDLFVRGGSRSMLMFRQVRSVDGFDTYLVTDPTVSNIAESVRTLKSGLDGASGRIDDIYTKLSGVINYHGVLSVGFDYANDGIESGFTKLFRKNDYDVDDALSAGWFYRVESDSDHHTIDSVKIGDGDFLKIESNVLVRDVTSADVIVVDTLDKDTAHFKDLEKLSAELNEGIGENKKNIEINLSLISNLSDDVEKKYFNKNSADEQEVVPNTKFNGNVTVKNLEVTGTFKAQREEAEVVVTELSAT